MYRGKSSIKFVGDSKKPDVPQRDLASELYESISNYLKISQFFTSAPIGIHRLNRETCLSTNWRDRVYQCLHLTWCFAVFMSVLICSWFEYKFLTLKIPLVQKPLYICELLFCLLHMLNIILSAYKGRYHIKLMLQKIVDFDQCLSNYGIGPKYNLLSKFLRLHLYLLTVYFTCTTIINCNLSHRRWFTILRGLNTFLFSNLILQISLTQYYCLLYAITRCAFSLNLVLKRILLANQSGACNSVYLQRKLNEIRRLYAKLEVFTKNINEFYAIPIVIVYMGSLLNISLNIFLIYKHIAKPDMSRIASAMYSVVWTFMHIGRMFLVMFYNQGVQNQKAGAILLLNEIKGDSAEVEETIIHFMLQLHANTRSNVVSGVAKLNLGFFTPTLVNISTLFIFLLQHDITYRALQVTHTVSETNATSNAIA